MKKFLRLLLIAIAAVWVIRDPGAAAHLAHHVMASLAHAARSASRLANGL